MAEKSAGEKRQDELFYKPQNAWLKVDEDEKKQAFDFCEGYKDFLNNAKTEREVVGVAEKKAIDNGFVSLDEYISGKKRLKPGDKVYSINRDKNIILAVIGEEPLEKGLNIIGAHIDSPRIDLKLNPLYEDSGLALLKTHYYGGIKKYQWVTKPLALHGVIIKSDGEKVEIKIGEDENDPQFCITDLLPHLADNQEKKKLSEGITGEGLNVLFGNIPYNDKKVKKPVKLQIMELLNQKYGIKEEDFQRAELEMVPAFKARDIGLDRSMVGGYGQDDRVCAFTALEGILKTQKPKRTAMCFLVDKEEIGSEGNTGAQSSFFENTIGEMCSLSTEGYNDIVLKRSITNSKVLSVDTPGVVDPSYKDRYELQNAIIMGNGVVVRKSTASAGKYDSNDANAEFTAQITNMLNNHKITWQSGLRGKIDIGGGGTISNYMATRNLDVIDMGIGILSMHAPFEVTSKIDIYMGYRAFKGFYEDIE